MTLLKDEKLTQDIKEINFLRVDLNECVNQGYMGNITKEMVWIAAIIEKSLSLPSYGIR